MEHLNEVEQKGKRRGRTISLAFHAVMLLLAFLWGCPYEPEKAQARQYHVAVNFEKIEFQESPSSNSTKSKAKEGATRKKADPVAKIDKTTERVEVKKPKVELPKPTPPKPRPPVPTPPIQTKTTSVEETEVVVAEPEVEVAEVEVDDVPSPEVIDVPDPEEVKLPPRTKVNAGTKNTSKSSTQSNAPNSTADGNGTGKGRTGTGPGADKDGNDGDSGRGTGGTGLGEYDDSGRGIFGRRVIHRNIAPILRGAVAKSGKIVFKVCINNRGSVSFAELDELSTTISDRKILSRAMEAVFGYKYEPDPRAPEEECGKLSINIDNFNGLRAN